MPSIQGPNINNYINQAIFNAIGTNSKKVTDGSANALSAELIYNTFFKDVKTKSEFKKKIRKTLLNLNENLSEEEVETILDSLDMKEHPPFCASYSEEGVSEQLQLKDNLMRSDLYDILLHFYGKLYTEANSKIS